ncbi:MAG: glycosyltransferase, partial [Methylobacteriaceae bacterium]|nr:glycosyltransferase [Methylobacteriaceae bacterium]
GAELGARVAEERQGARRLLLAGDGPRATAASRRAIRERIAELRRDGPAPLAFELAGDARPAPPPAPRPAGTAESPPVCVIVPVYRGRADLEACLDSLRPELAPGRVRAIVINDASPEAEIGRYLAELAADPPPGLTILENGSNLGFVGTVNRGFAALAPGEDALVLNADTVLAPGALARLAAHCHARPGVASVTPLSNTATILGFPHPPEPNPPAFGLDAATIDAALRAVGAAPLEIPTAIGFCMYLNGEALAEAGPFSPEWGRGYCEEVDWSLIARDLGWIHLAAPDAFVMHEGSVSFGRSERSRILAENHARLEAKYPDYLAEVHAFLRADPLEETRIGALARLLAGQASRLTLHVTHGLGGGTSRHIADLAARPRPPGHEFATVLPLDDALRPDRIVLRFDRSGTEISLRAASFGRLAAALEEAGIALAIEVHSRLGHHSALLDAIRSGGRPYRATLHDFQWYCPKVHLTDERDFHCGEPPPDICQICVRHPLPNHDPHDFGDETELVQRDIEAWLAGNAAFLRGAERIVAPSQDTADRYLRRLDLDTVVVEPHGEPERAWRERPSVRRPRTGALRVAVVGAIGFHKGFDLLVRLAERAAHDRAPFYLRVIGYTPDNAQLTRLPNADVTGPYASGELPALLDAFDPDFVFFSSVWPETYSYVLSEVWAAGYPVVAFDLGAPAERIRALGGGVLLEPTRDAGRLLAALLEVRDRAAASPIPGPPTAGTA